MKKLNWTQKIVFLINSLFAFLMLFANLVPYISPNSFPKISLFALATPGLIIINFIFSIYWIIRLKRQFILSLVVLLISYNQVNALYQLSAKQVYLNDDLKVMSYNVRVFDIYNWKGKGERAAVDEISKFVHDKAPDIVCFQEFNTRHGKSFDYKYQYVKEVKSKYTKNIGMAIVSKYKIINEGALDFENTSNNAIFIDIVRNKDTIRIYNVHLESQRIQLDKKNLKEENRDRLLKRLQKTFVKQEAQVKKLIAHESKCNYKTIIAGDFNNTAFSWAYNQLKGNKKDAFVEAGNNFGKSYDFFLPARIDFILVDPSYEVNHFETYSEDLSDHYPIMARLSQKQ